MSQSHLIFSNAIIIWAMQGLMLVPQLIMVPFLIRTIGEGGYGVYALVWSLMMSIDQLEKSLQSGVVKYSAGFLAQGRVDELNRVISSSFVYSILLALLACSGVVIFAVSYNDPSGQINSGLFIVGIMILFVVPLTPYLAVIQSKQRYYVGAIAGTISKYATFALVVIWFTWLTPSVKALIVIMALSMFISRIAQVPIAYRIVPGLRNRFGLFSKKAFGSIVTFGFSIVLASLCLALNSTGVRWLMDMLVSTSFVAHLAIMLMPSLLLGQIIGPITVTVMPATSAYEATGDQYMLQELLIRGMRYITILALGGVLAACLLMRNVLTAWVGTEYSFLTPYALLLFGSGAFMLSTSLAHHMLKGLGKLRIVVLIYFFGLVIVPIGAIFAVFQMLQNPYLAVTVGLCAGNLVCGCLNIVFCMKVVNAGLWKLLMRAYVQPLSVAVVAGLVGFSFVHFSGIADLVTRSCAAVSVILLFLSGCLIFIATPAERHQAFTFIKLCTTNISALWKIKSARIQ